jgi:DNA polymerase (family 10)
LNKAEVADILDEIGTLLELKGENPFKSRAYHNAARTITGLDQDLDALVQSKQLTSIKGIGEAIADKITALVTTGKLPYFDELQRSLPSGLMDMIRIQGLGPKRAKILYDQLKIKDIPSLEKACREGKVARLEGFGEKTQENILKGLEFLSQHAEQHRYDEALAAAEAVLSELKKIPEIERLSVCGSLRRHKEIIRDVDILASVAKATPHPTLTPQRGERESAATGEGSAVAVIMDRFVHLPQVERVLGQGDTKASVLLGAGIQVDVRVVDDRQFPYALHYFTGSKEHNIAMRRRAIERGWKLSEYGLFDQNEKIIPCKEEADIFKKLGLEYIPPELREDRGEIEAAEKGKLPRLIEPGDIRGVFHVHSTWSDGRATLEVMIAEAERLGWEYVGISDHSKSAAYAKGLTEERVQAQTLEIEDLRRKFKIRIFRGTECDILKDGSLDYSDKVLADYDFVIASVHSNFTLSEADMTRRILKALKNKYVTILGHMTGRLLLERDAYAVNQLDVLRAAADEGVAIELNANPHRFDIDWRQLFKARELHVKISINPDAHSVEGLGVVPYGVGIARKGWLSKEDVLNTLPVGKISTWLKERR